MILLGAIIGAFIGAIITIMNSKKGLSDKQIAKFEKKSGHTMTEEEKALELTKLANQGKKALILSVVLLIMFIVLQFLLV